MCIRDRVVATELEKEAESANSVTFVPGARTGSSGTEYKGIRCGDAADVRVNVNPTGNGSKVVFKAYQNGILLNYATVTFEADRAGEYRYYFSNQLNLENVEIIASVENAEITSSEATFIYERTARDFYQEHEAEPFKGGVNFDLIYK